MYQLTNTSTIVRTADGASIPPELANTDYADYLAWVADGNTPAPYSAPRKTQAQVQDQIKTERDRRKDGGTHVAGKWFHSDRDSRIQQIGLVIMGASVPAVQWKTMDGSFVTMTPTIAGGIFQATAALDMALFANAETHIAAVEALDDATDYDYSTGWPAHYTV